MNQEVPYKRFAVEGFVIVVSILLAFAIDAWWGNRQDALRERELLIQLESSFTNHINQAEAAIAGAADSLHSIRMFISSSPDEMEMISTDDASAIFSFLYRPRGLLQGLLDSRSIVAILDSNSLTLATDTNLLSALREWQGELETLEERNFDVLATTKETVEAMAVYPEVQQLFAAPQEERTASNALMRKIREDNQIMQYVAVRTNYATAQLNFLERVHNRANVVLELIHKNIN